MLLLMKQEVLSIIFLTGLKLHLTWGLLRIKMAQTWQDDSAIYSILYMDPYSLIMFLIQNDFKVGQNPIQK